MRIAIVHDYVTQRGGAERVVLALLDAFPGAPLHTSLYEPAGTFAAFADAVVRPMRLNAVRAFRQHHRLALPLLAPAFSRLAIDADVVVCSSSGWAHGAKTRGRKIVYCHAPARWLYQTQRYVGARRGPALAMRLLGPALRRWDRRAAATAHRFLANSSAVRDAIRKLYGVDADIVPPPPALVPDGPVVTVEGLEPGFQLCVSRLLPYKNVDVLLAAFAELADERLVVVGSGPLRPELERAAPGNARFLGTVSDDVLRWLYANCSGVVAASYEDYGLTPVEAAGFGKPSAVLRYGGFLDTVAEGRTGIFFERPDPRLVAEAIQQLRSRDWDEQAVRAHVADRSHGRFVERMREIVADEASR